MSTPFTNPNEELAALLRQLEEVAEKFRKLEAKQKQQKQQESKSWEPPGGEFYITPTDDVGNARSTESYRLAGSEYPTAEAAESVLPYIRFFKRLCCLAQSLNRSRKVGGLWCVRFDANFGSWYPYIGRQAHAVDLLFETENAAKLAAQIMNSDGWKLP